MMRGLDQTVSLENTVRVGMSILDSLKSLHSLGYVHRDIKADNMLLPLDRDTEEESRHGYP